MLWDAACASVRLQAIERSDQNEAEPLEMSLQQSASTGALCPIPERLTFWL